MNVQHYQDGVDGGLGVTVMTDDQMEMLRKQISVYSTICERLVQMHKAVSAKQHFSGMWIRNPNCDPMSFSGVHKIPARQRWAPKPAQLQKLEQIFEECNSTPGRQRIKDITSELAQYGTISESNVYNWFQNRRARSKRKQLGPANNNEEEDDEEPPAGDSGVEKKTKPEETIPDESSSALVAAHLCFQSPDRDLYAGLDLIYGKMETPLSYSSCLEDYAPFG